MKKAVYRIFTTTFDKSCNKLTRTQCVDMMNSSFLQPDDYAITWIIIYENKIKSAQWVSNHFDWIDPVDGKWE
jgi:hypothetical protein